MAAGVMLATFTGCKKEFLDLRPYTSLTPEDALATEGDLRVAMTGVYAGIRAVNIFGRTVPVLGDLMADNIYQHPQNSNRYTQYNLMAMSVNDGDAAGLWSSSYNAILRCNNIINSPLTGTPVINQIKGEAKAVRALLYFTLVRFYAKPYNDNPAALGVPIVLTFDIAFKPARSTVAQVYDLILKDLGEAFTEMTTFTNSSLMHKWAARALEAKVRLTRNDMAGALTAANDVIANSGFTVVSATNYGAYWSSATFRTDRVETLFEVSSDPVGNNGFDALGYITNQLGYGDMVISDPLFAMLTDTDVRKALYRQSVAGQTRHPAVFIDKFKNIATDRDETKLLRMSDIYLIAAEASVASNATNAQNFLNFVLSRRDPSAAAVTSTGQELTDAIIMERRKEFMVEGDRYHDLNRLKLSVERSTNYPASARSIAFTNPRRLLPIPEAEFNTNPGIAGQQNPGY
jgi:hypothetical protein